MYSSKNAREYRPGDILTVIISEEATAQQEASTNTQDNSQLEVKAAPSIPFFKDPFKQFLGKNEVKNNWKGTGTTTRSGKLKGTLTATILEVFPNGNLLIEGSRRIRINREAQIMRVRGIARPRDVDLNNSINSTLLADAEVKYEGKGTVGSVQKPGLMTRIANFIF